MNGRIPRPCQRAVTQWWIPGQGENGRTCSSVGPVSSDHTGQGRTHSGEGSLPGDPSSRLGPVSNREDQDGQDRGGVAHCLDRLECHRLNPWGVREQSG